MKKFILLLCSVLFAMPNVYIFASEQQPYSATVYIIRDKGPFGTDGFGVPIFVNDVELGKLTGKKYIECRIAPGYTSIHTIDGAKANQTGFNAESGGIYFVTLDVSLKNGFQFAIADNNAGVIAKNNSKLKFATDISNRYYRPELGVYVDTAVYASSGIIPQSQTQPQAIAAPSSQATVVAQIEPQPIRSSDVDKNIPETHNSADNTFVLIIANENYEFVDNVQYALNDGEAFREYCIKTLGVPERQVWLYKDASAGIVMGGVDKMVQAMNIFEKPRAIVYYCGHGIPEEKTGDAYIIPTDGNGKNMATCYSLNRLYKTLSKSNADNITYFFDACFTGANREGSMLVAARGVAREAKKEMITGNTVVFSAASGDETAMPYKEKQHGLFTYFLLKKLQETQGKVTYGELADYIYKNVRKEAFLTNDKLQNPVVATSDMVADSWKNIKL